VATTLTIGVVDQTAFIQHQSMTCKLNTLDLTLVDPATTPQLGDAVTLTEPTWAGTIVKVGTTDPVDRQGHVLVKIAATNQDTAAASAAPFGLSDDPDNSTTYGYRGLTIESQANQDGTTTLHGSCTIQQSGLWPAMTFELTSANRGLSAAGFSVVNVTVTWPRAGSPQFAVEFGDAIVTMAVWAASQAGAAPPGSIDGTRITPGTVDTPQLRANSVTAAQILAGTITADKLASTLVLASLLKTAAPDGTDPGTGLRIELDHNGLRAYDSTNRLVVNIPTDGSPVYVSGQLSATSLVATVSTLLQGTAQLGIGATMTVQNNVADPIAAPVLVGSVPALALASSPAHANAGLCYDSGGGAGGATPSFWIGAKADDASTLDVAYEYDATTGALLRTLKKTGSTTTYTATLGSTSHIADRANGAVGTTNSQIATPLTFPARDNIQITKVSVYMAGRLGTCQVKTAVWNTSGTLLRESAAYTASSGGATTVGASDHYDKALSSPLAVASGATIWAGFLRPGTSDGSQYDVDTGSNTTKIGQGNDGSMTSISTVTTEKPNVYVTYTYTVDSSLEGAMGGIVGVARVGSYIWVLDDLGTLFQYNQADLSYVGKVTSAAAYIAGAKAGAGLFYDGTNLVITTAAGTGSSVQVRFIKLNSSTGAYVSTLDTTGLAVNGTTATIRGGTKQNDALTSSHATYWVAIGGAFAGVYGYDTTSSPAPLTANRDFGLAGEISGGVAFDGTAFRGWSASALTSVWTFTSWDWNSASQPFWVGYSWVDDVGTPHETLVSPRASISLGRRRQLTVTIPTIPTGGADDPDKLGLYMYQGASDPGATGFKQQSTGTATTIVLTSYNAAGAADPSSNNFPGGTPASIQSQIQAGPGWKLTGDGLATFQQAALIRAVDSLAIDPAGLVPFAFHGGAGVTNATDWSGAPVSLAAVSGGNGGAAIMPVVLTAPMRLISYNLWCTDTASARSAEARLYRDDGSTTLQFVTGSDASWSFTPSAAAARSAAVSAGSGVLLRPGVYWLVIRNKSTTHTFGIGGTANAASSIFPGHGSASLPALGSTLALTLATATGRVLAASLRGAVQGTTTIF